MLGALLLAAALVAGSSVVRAQGGPDEAELAARLERVAARVEEFYALARTITATETVRIRPLAADLSPRGRYRELVYELRIAWEPPVDGGPPSEPTVLRELLLVNGRPPRPRDEPECMDLKAVSPEALSMLLPHRHGAYAFTLAGSGRTDGRASVTIGYRSVESGPAEVTWRDDCVSVSLPGRSRGRIWLDSATDDVLRLDEELVGIFEFAVPRERGWSGSATRMVIERANSSIRYKPVTFENPDETLMLPSSVETMTAWRNAGVSRVLTTQVSSEFRRFVTEGRIVER